MMRFSVTIPAYKALYLHEAIKSVVCQTYSDWELFIVDDCSPEDLHSIVKPYLCDTRVSYYRNAKNCGAAHVVDNWNICLSYCTGDYVICMGDDDRLLPNCLEYLCQTISHNPGLNVYHLQTEIIDEEGKVKELLEKRAEREDVLTAMCKRWKGRKQFIGDFCFSRKHLCSYGGYYNLPYAWGSDDVSVFRAMLPKGIANAQKPCFQYRENIHSISLSLNDKEKVASVLLMKKWHKDTLLSLLSQGIYTKEEILNASVAMHHSVKGLISYHIQRDICQGDIKRFWYWLKNNPNQAVSRYDIFKMYIVLLIRKL